LKNKYIKVTLEFILDFLISALQILLKLLMHILYIYINKENYQKEMKISNFVAIALQYFFLYSYFT
jgi:hypothetical protein